jgi:hypothetical protein
MDQVELLDTLRCRFARGSVVLDDVAGWPLPSDWRSVEDESPDIVDDGEQAELGSQRWLNEASGWPRA